MQALCSMILRVQHSSFLFRASFFLLFLIPFFCLCFLAQSCCSAISTSNSNKCVIWPCCRPERLENDCTNSFCKSNILLSMIYLFVSYFSWVFPTLFYLLIYLLMFLVFPILLIRDKWINYIDLSKRNDFNPSTSFYFWYLDLPLLKSTIRDHVYQTMLNLTLR